MNKLRMIIMIIFCTGCIGYGLVNLIFIFANDFVYRHTYLLEKIRNISFAFFMFGLFLLVIIKIIERFRG